MSPASMAERRASRRPRLRHAAGQRAHRSSRGSGAASGSAGRSQGPPKMIWKGHISFGLVNVPVGLYPAESADELDFTLVDTKDMSPIGYRKVSKATGEEVPPDRIARGFEYAKGRY